MKKEELIQKLTDFGVLDKYSLNGYIGPSLRVLYPSGTLWELFFVNERMEREQRPLRFSSAEEAYDYIYDYEFKARENIKSVEERDRNMHTIVSQVQGDDFMMTKTERVYIPPDPEKDGNGGNVSD